MAQRSVRGIPTGQRRLPKQRRSREIVDAIVQAARGLLETRDPDAITTNHIAERAGISIGSLYRYFPDKDAVYAAIYEEDTRREAEDLANHEWLLDSNDLNGALVELVDFQLERHRRLIELGGGFYKECHDFFSLSQRIGRDDAVRRVRTVLENHAGEVRVGDCEQAAYLIVRGLSAIIRRVTEERPDKLDNQAFRRELVDMALLYVTGSPAAQSR